MPYELNVEYKAFNAKRAIKKRFIKDARKMSYMDSDSRNRYGVRRRLSFKKSSMQVVGQMSAKPAVNYWSETEPRKDAPYLIGLEIEIENESTYNQNIMAASLDKYLSNGYYVCTDGSLHNYGYEIVTAPRTSAEIKQSYHLYYGLLTKLASLKYTAHDNNRCGLHVHISRKAMPDPQWIKLSKFMSRNKTIFEKLSRRTNFGYSQFRHSVHDRYSALNFTCSQTREFRFFRGTLNPKSFFASLEIILSLVEFFRVPSKSYGLKRYVKFLKEAKYKYGYSYFLDMHPTLENGYRRYTVEERAYRKEQRRIRSEQRLSQLRVQLRDICSNAEYSIRGRQPLGSDRLSLSIDQHQLLVAPIPVFLSSDFSAALRQMAVDDLRTIRVPFFPSTLSAEQRQNLHVFIDRMRGWGNSRPIVQIRTTPPSYTL